MILDGKKLAECLRKELKESVESKCKTKPTLAIIQVGNNAASNVYVTNKEKACKEVGIFSVVEKFNEDVTEEELLNSIRILNEYPEYDGIIVQLPLPKHINAEKVTQAILPSKDVDGFTYVNQGKLQYGAPGLKPCTPAGIIELLKAYDIRIAGKRALVIGRSNIVGRPLAEMLLKEDATVTVAHSKSKNLTLLLAHAEIVISAVGESKFIESYMIPYNQVLVDVGMNRDENGKLCGDIHPECYSKCDAYTPVPGGVGPMTIAMLLQNVVTSNLLRSQSERKDFSDKQK